MCVYLCVCVCVCVAMLPSLVLHRASFRPYQRGLYCSDSSLKYPYKNSTVPSSVLTSVGLTLPAVSVSPPPTKSTPPRGTLRVETGRAGGSLWQL